MRATGLEVADIFRQIGPAYRQEHADALSRGQRRVMRDIERCRTAALGGHVEQCDACGHQRIAFNSCRNRHCPKCQSLVRAQWLEDRQAELLPVEYFHVVFTVPQEIAAIAYQNKAVVYDILFHATAETLRTIAADPKHLGAEIGFIAILHTWGQNLLHHPHLHCVVPGGGLSPDGQRWIACRPGFFLPVRVLSRLFRRLFLTQLRQAFDDGELHFFNSLAALQDRRCLRQLPGARRARRVGRLRQAAVRRAAAGAGVPRPLHPSRGDLQQPPGRLRRRPGRLRWKDYRHESRRKVMRLDARGVRAPLPAACAAGGLPAHPPLRPAGQPLPRGQARRTVGNCWQAPAPVVELPAAPLDYRDRYQRLTGVSLRDCPQCGRGQMVRIESFLPGTLPRGPPATPP